ncbi:hypothetical protein [Thiobacter aerophilum]|uniref:Uncharacterized protein n=1 Tax=Thiobacter aerophilum TaxID=3121275 RepID=A0ABV0EHC2_9BURK
MRDAECVIASGGSYVNIVSTPRAMRAMGLRGKIVCEHFDGRRAYSVLAHRVIERVLGVLAELERK